MTNFEKWKRDLTIDKLVEWVYGYGCFSCPARKQCSHEACEASFIEWMNAEAKESEMENEKEEGSVQPETREMKAARISMLRADAEFAGILQTERLVETFLRIRIGETHDAVAALREEIQKLKDQVDAKKKNALAEYCRLNGIDTSKWEESDEKDS